MKVQTKFWYNGDLCRVEAEVSGKHRPAVMYLPNGDPGHPEEWPDIDYNKVEIYNTILYNWCKLTDEDFYDDFLEAMDRAILEALNDL